MATTMLVPAIIKVAKINLAVEPNVVVIIPTYCEAKNIEKLIRKIQRLDLNLRIIVIDDSSPDQTPQIVKRMGSEFDNVVLISRPKKMGLGTAITNGFFIALKLNPVPDFIITMDSDFSHDPADIPQLVKIAKKGYHLVIGSRYVSGGCMKNWPFSRRILSRTANLLATGVVGVKLKDFTSGFRCYSKDYVAQVLSKLHSTTYEIQIETIRQAYLNNHKIKEIPITFINRKNGNSKLSSTEILGFTSYILVTMLSNFFPFLKRIF